MGEGLTVGCGSRFDARVASAIVPRTSLIHCSSGWPPTVAPTAASSLLVPSFGLACAMTAALCDVMCVEFLCPMCENVPSDEEAHPMIKGPVGVIAGMLSMVQGDVNTESVELVFGGDTTVHGSMTGCCFCWPPPPSSPAGLP
jgi:hypothetical protein